MSEYRVVKYYHNFFAHDACKLQKRGGFLWWKWWNTISDDHLGHNCSSWVERYNCKVVKE